MRGVIDVKEDGTISVVSPNSISKLLVQTDEKRILTRQSIKVSLNPEGFFIDEQDNHLLGYLSNNSFAAERIRINADEVLFSPTRNITMMLNLSTAATEYTQNITIYDPFSTARELKLEWQKQSRHAWNVAFSCPEAEQLTFDDQTVPSLISFKAGKEEGVFTKQPILSIQWKPEFCDSPSKICFTNSVVTTTDSDFRSTIKQDGIPYGYFTGYQFMSNNRVLAKFSNGFEKVIASIALTDN